MMIMMLSSSSITFVNGFFVSPGNSAQFIFSPYYPKRSFSAAQPIRLLFSSTTATIAEAPPQIKQKKQCDSSVNKKLLCRQQQLVSSIETKRRFCLSLILAAAAFPTTALSSLLSFPALSTAMAADKEDRKQQEQQPVLVLERYTDINEGFTLLRPSSWIKVEKAGATVLFEDNEKKGTNNLGVVVSPIRISSLGEFGSPQFVADKLIQAEKRKESTNDAQVIGVAERLGHGGLQVYEFEYMLDSTRGGMKRIFSAAFVASKKLYLLNISYSDRPENPLDISTRMMLEEVLHSFDTAAVL